MQDEIRRLELELERKRQALMAANASASRPEESEYFEEEVVEEYEEEIIDDDEGDDEPIYEEDPPGVQYGTPTPPFSLPPPTQQQQPSAASSTARSAPATAPAPTASAATASKQPPSTPATKQQQPKRTLGSRLGFGGGKGKSAATTAAKPAAAGKPNVKQQKNPNAPPPIGEISVVAKGQDGEDPSETEVYTPKMNPIKEWKPTAGNKPQVVAATPSEPAVVAAWTLNAGHLPPLPAMPFKARIRPDPSPSPAGKENIMEKLFGAKLISNANLSKTSTLGCFQNQQLVMLYFGKKMLRECKSFLPHLIDFYCTTTLKHQVECIYISVDRNLQEFKEVYMTMPFLAIPGGGTATLKNHLSAELKVTDLPSLCVLEVSTGYCITTRGVEDILTLQRNNVEHADALIARWKSIQPVPMDQVKMDTRLKFDTMELGIIKWS